MQTMTSQLDRNNSTKKIPRGLPGAFRSAPVVGRILGPLLALAVYFLLPEDPALTADARSVAAVATLIAIWWMTEALPLAVTSLLPLVLLPLTGAVQVSAAAAPYASPIVFLFMGGFVIALSLQRWNLHRRIALLVLRAVGTKPRTIVLGIMVATGFLSMWVNNTATTVMMIPIALSLTVLAAPGLGDGSPGEGLKALAKDKDSRNFTLSMLLGVAYSASIGGLGTPVGSTPNLILMGYLNESMPERSISFAQWMLIGIPTSWSFLLIGWLVLTRLVFPTKLKEVAGGREQVRGQLSELGPMSRQEWSVTAVFVSAALLWVFRGALKDIGWLTELLPFLPRLTDEMIAIAAAVVLFLLPGKGRKALLDWDTVQKGIPWGALLLFGGGLSLAAAVQSSKLNTYIGNNVTGLGALPVLLLIASVCILILLLTELTSNTATAATFIPVLAAVALSVGIDPLLMLIPAAMAASCAFILPVGTPPNAIVYGTGYVPISQMIRAGVVMNVVGVVLITGAVMLLGRPLLGIGG